MSPLTSGVTTGELPTDRLRSATGAFRRSSLDFVLSTSAGSLLAAVGQTEDSALFLILLAAFKALLWRYTEQADILVGVPAAGQHVSADVHSDPAEELLGVRTELGDNPTFRELLARVRASVFEVRAATEARPGIVLRNIFSMSLAREIGLEGMDVALHVTPSQSGLCGRLYYNAELFDVDRMERMVGHWKTLLAGIVADPDQRLSALPLLTATERHELLVTWNSTQTESPREGCLHDFFERHARQTPDAVALTFGDRQWSYGEINCQSNRLAHHLQGLGVRPDAPVAICLERSAEMIVGVLAILKAGGAYVPLDPDYPLEQLEFVMQDAETEVLLTTRTIAANLPLKAAHLICLDDAKAALANQPTTNPACTAGPENAAYIIYTSGSTGKPKGVIVDHGNAVHLIQARMQYSTELIERFALICSIAFDASVVVIFNTLSVGGTLALPPQGAERDVARLCEWIERQQVTHWVSVPALYNLLLEQPVQRLASLRAVIVGGEACSAATVRRHRELLPGAKLYNEYGPTEGTVCSTVYHCAGDPGNSSVPIGRPIPNVRLYVLDSNMNPVPVGIPGELYLGGAGVARGYLRRPELTAERFIADPFGDAGCRLYRTGDRVRYLADGNLEFLGRVDHQIKIRGHRVELGEIEAALRLDPAISEAVVLVRQSEGKRPQLVAHVVPKPLRRPTPVRLRRALRGRLPNHMVPAFYRLHDALPLTPNGKVDRQALGALDLQSGSPDREYTPPTDEIELKLATIWRQLFDLRRIGGCDDFFELGGDSLLAAGLCARIEQEFGQVVSPDLLLERPTIRQLASVLRHPSRETSASLVTIQSGRAGPPLFCLPGIGGNVMEFRGLAQLLGAEQLVYGFRPVGADDGHPPHTSIVEMATHNIHHMRLVQPKGPYYLAGYSLGGVVAFEMALQLRAAGETTALLALLDSRLWLPPVSLSTTQRLRLHWQNLHQGDHLGRWNYLRERARILVERIRRGNLRHQEDDVVFGLDLSPASRKLAHVHWRAWRDYQPRVLDNEITLFVAHNHPGLATATQDDDPTLGWDRWTTQPVVVTRTACRHVDLLRASGLRAMAQHIARCLQARSENRFQLTKAH
jgi:amino acid adenylation domain-containing protein